MKDDVSNTYTFKLINKTTNFTKSYTVEDIRNYFPNGYSFDFYDPTLKEDEYEYELIDAENTIVSKGLIDFGDYNSNKNTTEYNQAIEYNMYEAHKNIR